MTLMTGADNRSVNGMPGVYMHPGSAYTVYFYHVRARQMGDDLIDSGSAHAVCFRHVRARQMGDALMILTSDHTSFLSQDILDTWKTHL